MLMRFFVHQFIANRSLSNHELYSDTDDSSVDSDLTDAQFICTACTEFMQFLKDQKKSEDKWISTCANFLEMSYDFIEFVTAYRIGDAISIEFGYQKHAPVWKALNQNKYIDIFYSQHESLYRDITFSILQEIRLNRVVRRYHGNTGKRCVAHDEFLEHGNRFFSNLPLPKTLTGFVFQSNYVGIGLMCKRHTDLWCSTVWKGDVSHDYRVSVIPTMTPEKKLIYSVFALLNTHQPSSSRTTFKRSYIMSIKTLIKVDLRHTVLENSMHVAPASNADDILTSLDSVYGDVSETAGINPMADGELEGDDLDELRGVTETVTVDDDANRPDSVGDL